MQHRHSPVPVASTYVFFVRKRAHNLQERPFASHTVWQHPSCFRERAIFHVDLRRIAPYVGQAILRIKSHICPILICSLFSSLPSAPQLHHGVLRNLGMPYYQRAQFPAPDPPQCSHPVASIAVSSRCQQPPPFIPPRSIHRQPRRFTECVTPHRQPSGHLIVNDWEVEANPSPPTTQAAPLRGRGRRQTPGQDLSQLDRLRSSQELVTQELWPPHAFPLLQQLPPEQPGEEEILRGRYQQYTPFVNRRISPLQNSHDTSREEVNPAGEIEASSMANVAGAFRQGALSTERHEPPPVISIGETRVAAEDTVNTWMTEMYAAETRHVTSSLHPRSDIARRTIQLFRQQGHPIIPGSFHDSAILNRRVAFLKAISSLESTDNFDNDETSMFQTSFRTQFCAICTNNTLVCNICYNNFGDKSTEGIVEVPVRLPKCKHIFGNYCISKWFAVSARCPYCRDKVHAGVQLHTTGVVVQQFVRRPQSNARSATIMSPGQHNNISE